MVSSLDEYEIRDILTYLKNESQTNILMIWAKGQKLWRVLSLIPNIKTKQSKTTLKTLEYFGPFFLWSVKYW